MTSKESQQIKKMNRKLNAFLGIAITLISIAVYLAFDNAGFKREIKIEIQGFRELFEMHLKQDEYSENTMKRAIEINRQNHRELTDKLLQNGTVKDLTVREIPVN